MCCLPALPDGARAGNLDTIGITLVRQHDATLKGAGIKVAQVEAPENGTNTPSAFQANPSAVSQPASLFRYISSQGTSTTFPNALGVESGHANGVAAGFFGASSGAAPQLNHVDNYEANSFYNLVASLTAIQSPLVNQSFIFLQSTTVERDYDDYAARYRTLFVSGAGFNGLPLSSNAMSFNCIVAGVSDDGNPPYGPTLDGRCKPDLVAPGTAASFSTAYASGCAAVLLQAAARGDGGTNYSAATNLLTLKALLLNGAVKPGNWTNSSPASPLDRRWGAGVVNAFNSWQQLKGGRHLPLETTSVSAGSPHPPGTNPASEPALAGWDYNWITNSAATDKVNHYYLQLPGTNAHTLTATLVWNRQQGKTGINDLNLFLYRTTDNQPVISSVSTVDNVEHLFVPHLPPGRYDLQVLKKGAAGQVSNHEAYGLAFECFNLQLNIARTNGSNVLITWPVSPAGFQLFATPQLTPPVSWAPVAAAVSVLTNSGLNAVLLPAASSNQFFRLQRP